MDFNEMNDYLVDIFNNILIIEENSLRSSHFSDVTIKEMHTIDVIGKNPEITPSEVAKALMVTLGTVTTSLNRLEEKQYITRTRSTIDRRVVHLTLSQKGEMLYRVHQKFHKQMVNKVTADLTTEEVDVLSKGLKNLHAFLEELK